MILIIVIVVVLVLLVLFFMSSYNKLVHLSNRVDEGFFYNGRVFEETF